jgi:hypothetical protein
MAEPCAFDEANVILDVEDSLDEPFELEPINANLTYVAIESRKNSIRSIYSTCWRITKEDLEIIQKTGRLWVISYGSVPPPTGVTAEKPIWLDKEFQDIDDD